MILGEYGYTDLKQDVQTLLCGSYYYPDLTNLPIPDDLSARVYIVTGASSGVGFEVTKLLTARKAKVYMAARSATKLEAAKEALLKEQPDALVDFLIIDLADLVTVKPGLEPFLEKESQLHGLFLNAGVMASPSDWTTKQGYEMQLGTNCVGHHLVQRLLADIMKKTAKSSPPNTVRTLFVSSNGSGFSTFDKGFSFDKLNATAAAKLSPSVNYAVSKAINVYQGILWSKYFSDSPVFAVSCNPGPLRTELSRHISGVTLWVVNKLLHPAVYGACTEVWAVLSPELTKEKDSGAFIIPFGRLGSARKDLVSGANGEQGEKLWAWLNEATDKFM